MTSVNKNHNCSRLNIDILQTKAERSVKSKKEMKSPEEEAPPLKCARRKIPEVKRLYDEIRNEDTNQSKLEVSQKVLKHLIECQKKIRTNTPLSIDDLGKGA